mgnify:CR=1 FL=1
MVHVFKHKYKRKENDIRLIEISCKGKMDKKNRKTNQIEVFKFKPELIFCVLLFVIAPLINIAFAYSIKFIIDTGMKQDVTGFRNSIFFGIGVIILFTLMNYFSQFFKIKYIGKNMNVLRGEIFSCIIHKNYTEFSQKNSSKYINSLTTQMKSVEQDYFNEFFGIIKNISLMVASLIAMFIGNYKLAALVCVACLIPMFLTGILGKLAQDGQKASIASDTKYMAKIKDILQGFLVIKSFHIENQVSKDYEGVSLEMSNTNHKTNKIMALTRSISELSGMIVFLVAFGCGIYMVLQGSTTIGSVTSIVQLVNFVVMPLNELGVSMNKHNSGKVVLEQLLDTVIPEDNNTNVERLEDKSSFDKCIEYKNVNFSYTPEGAQVLKDFNLRIEKGKKYALVGMSGSGKSTIMNLLLKFFEVEQGKGEILIDGMNINKVSSESLYKLLTIVQQNVYIFDDTLKANITLNQDYSEREIQEALELSGLKEFVDNSKNGLNMSCGENGSLLSGGQKQRISIARSVLRKTPVLLMDEATSSLDMKTTYEVENSILNIKDLTSMIITHKLEETLLKKYDEIIFMKNGNIIEHGSFDELVARESEFYSLFRAFAE